MEEPTHVIMRCPNGHDLRVASADVGKPLSCPVCNTVFQTAGGSAQGPAALSYAGGGGYGGPVEKPRFTTWLLVLWFVVEGLGIANSYASSMDPNPFLGCFIGALGIAAIVLQLVWIHRIHKDAMRSRGYRDVSPGTALGLSFIPYFNYAWTGWTLKKLAEFTMKLQGTPNNPDDPVVRAGRLCFYFGIVKLSVCVVAFVGGIIVGIAAAQQIGSGAAASPASFNPLAEVGMGFWVLISITNLLSFVSMLVYLWAVRTIEPALYSALTTAQTPPSEESPPSPPLDLPPPEA